MYRGRSNTNLMLLLSIFTFGILILFTIETTYAAAVSQASLAAGQEHSIALKSDGTLLAWGSNQKGQLGDGTTLQRNSPVVVNDATGNAVTGITGICASYFSSIALRSDGTLLVWGDNAKGQLGDGTTLQRNSPVPVRDVAGNVISGVVAIAAGANHMLALKGDGTLLAWGENAFGQLGDGTNVQRNSPVVVTDIAGNAISGVTAVAGGGNHSLALKGDGTLLGWGYNSFAQLGDGTVLYSRPNPVQVRDSTGVVVSAISAIAAGNIHSFALNSSSTMLAWGNNFFGQLGDGTNIQRKNPVAVLDATANNLTGVSSIASGSSHAITLKADGTLLAWGANSAGQLGDGSSLDRSTPVVVSDASANAISAVVSIAAGSSHTVAKKADGTLLAWGSNTAGQLGDGTTVNRSNPVVVIDAAGQAVQLGATALPTVSLTLNATSYITGDILTLNRTMVAGSPASNADIYVALQLPDGTLLVKQPDGSFTTAITALQTNLPVPTSTDTVFNYTFTGTEPAGAYTWYAALMQPGTLNVIGVMASKPFTFSP